MLYVDIWLTALRVSSSQVFFLVTNEGFINLCFYVITGYLVVECILNTNLGIGAMSYERNGGCHISLRSQLLTSTAFSFPRAPLSTTRRGLTSCIVIRNPFGVEIIIIGIIIYSGIHDSDYSY